MKLINKIFYKAVTIFRFKLNAIINCLPRFTFLEILENNYPINAKFIFIQVGANDGISFDELYDFVIKRNSSGLVVEPIKEYYEQLVENYKNFKNIKKINLAIHPSLSEIELYKLKKETSSSYPDWTKGIASSNSDHYKKFKISDFDVERVLVKACHFMQLLANYQVDKVDLVQIDTEGFDGEIIKMIDFSKIKPKVIKFEKVNLSEDIIQKTKNILYNNGYMILDEGNDSIAIDLSKIRLF